MGVPTTGLFLAKVVDVGAIFAVVVGLKVETYIRFWTTLATSWRVMTVGSLVFVQIFVPVSLVAWEALVNLKLVTMEEVRGCAPVFCGRPGQTLLAFCHI